LSKTEKIRARLLDYTRPPEDDWAVEADDDKQAREDVIYILEENKRLREALEFYSNPGDYKAPYTAGLGKLYFDCGDTALEALKEEK